MLIKIRHKNPFKQKLIDLSFNSYKEYLESEWWITIKKKFYHANPYPKCFFCGSLNNLQIHHHTYKRLGEEKLSDLICLCSTCHAKTHDCLKKNKFATLKNAAKKIK